MISWLFHHPIADSLARPNLSSHICDRSEKSQRGARYVSGRTAFSDPVCRIGNGLLIRKDLHGVFDHAHCIRTVRIHQADSKPESYRGGRTLPPPPDKVELR